MKLKLEEKKKSAALLQERMSKPLAGNLALNFLFKDQDIGEIIGAKAKNESQIQRMSTV
jgi:hypothetical protein